jgi:hypothetical protein
MFLCHDDKKAAPQLEVMVWAGNNSTPIGKVIATNIIGLPLIFGPAQTRRRRQWRRRAIDTAARERRFQQRLRTARRTMRQQG